MITALILSLFFCAPLVTNALINLTRLTPKHGGRLSKSLGTGHIVVNGGHLLSCMRHSELTIFVSTCCEFFFFKQKTAYEIASCLVGSEMCIRDRVTSGAQKKSNRISAVINSRLRGVEGLMSPCL